jgi:SAM-dependent methyltransferase
MTASAGMTGFAPTIKIEPYNIEAARYRKLWESAQYREIAPGEYCAMEFLNRAKPEPDATLIDFGCGTGRGGALLAKVGKLRVTLVDFADNSLDVEVAKFCRERPERIGFHVADLTKTLPMNAAYGYCTDVLEHIPTDDVPTVLRNILASARNVFFSIALFDDVHGKRLSDGPLHLTVKPAEWWRQQLIDLGAVIYWSSHDDNYAKFYASAWKDAADIIKIGKINTPEDTVDAQVVANIRAGWQHVMPHDKQDREVILLAGGPSMTEQLDEIRKLRTEGAALVTVNGAYGWALEHGLEPSAQIVLDARAFNARFVLPVTGYTKYLIASQAHMTTLEPLPRERTFLWHSGLSDANEALVREVLGGQFWPIPGGSTVVLRAIPLLRLLGFWRIHLFGFDSCVRMNGEHHAYAQAENDREILVPVELGGKVFQCAPWQVSQATEFRDLVAFLGDEVECAVYGDGLIASMVETGAQISTEGA